MTSSEMRKSVTDVCDGGIGHGHRIIGVSLVEAPPAERVFLNDHHDENETGNTRYRDASNAALVDY